MLINLKMMVHCKNALHNFILEPLSYVGDFVSVHSQNFHECPEVNANKY